jgi:hypothetical protein
LSVYGNEELEHYENECLAEVGAGAFFALFARELEAETRAQKHEEKRAKAPSASEKTPMCIFSSLPH